MHKNICKENNFKCNIFWKNLVNGYLNFDHVYRYFNINWKDINCNYQNKICIIMFSKWKANFFIAKFTNSYFYLKYEHTILYTMKNLLVLFVFLYFNLCSISIKKKDLKKLSMRMHYGHYYAIFILRLHPINSILWYLAKFIVHE